MKTKWRRTCAKYADSGHPAHVQSNIRAFALHLYILQYQMIMLADRDGPDQTVRMRRLIWAFAVHICPKTHFSIARPLKCRTQQLSSALSSAGYFKTYCCKQCGPRSDCSSRSSLIWVHTVYLYAKESMFEKFARRCSRRHKQMTFSDVVFLGILTLVLLNKLRCHTHF